MISIIICSRTKTLNPDLRKNIGDTIGVRHEIIVVDNSEKSYTIFEAYNEGLLQSKYPVLCFMHDDIYYHTNNWGNAVNGYFSDAAVGAVGIAGSPYLSRLPGSWWGGGLVNQYIVPVHLQAEEFTGDPNQPAVSEVIVLDGVWLCIRRSVFDQASFDTVNYGGFHLYDLDICMQVHLLNYKLYSITDVLISHYSKGDMNRDWCDNTLVFHQKWSARLPAATAGLTYRQKCEAELRTFKEYIYQLLYNGYRHRQLYQMVFRELIGCKQIYFYYRTPAYFLKYLQIIARFGIKSLKDNS